MSDVAAGARQLIQDLIAPDLKAIAAKQDGLAARLDGLEKHIALQHDVLIKILEAFRAEMRSEFLSLRAGNQLEVQRQLAPLSERVAVLETQRARH
jgi:hypothetical protein